MLNKIHPVMNRIHQQHRRTLLRSATRAGCNVDLLVDLAVSLMREGFGARGPFKFQRARSWLLECSLFCASLFRNAIAFYHRRHVSSNPYLLNA